MNKSCQSGFTLVELMIALAIFTAISAASFVALNSAVHSYSFLTAASKDQMQAEIFIAQLTRDFLQLVPRIIRDANGDYQPAFALGGEYQVAFSRSGLPRLGGNTGLGRVAYLLEKQQIWRYSWLYMDNIRTTEPNKTLVLDKVSTFDIIAVNRDLKDVRQWPPSDSDNASLLALPQAIQVTVAVKGKGRFSRFVPGVSEVYQRTNDDDREFETVTNGDNAAASDATTDRSENVSEG